MRNNYIATHVWNIKPNIDNALYIFESVEAR